MHAKPDAWHAGERFELFKTSVLAGAGRGNVRKMYKSGLNTLLSTVFAASCSGRRQTLLDQDKFGSFLGLRAWTYIIVFYPQVRPHVENFGFFVGSVFQ